MVDIQAVETTSGSANGLPENVGQDESGLQEFTRVLVEFALWHPSYRFDSVDVTVRAEGATNSRCHLVARSAQLGTIECGATGANEREAIQHVASILEAEFNRRIERRMRPPAVRASRPAHGWRKLIPPTAVPANVSTGMATWSAR